MNQAGKFISFREPETNYSVKSGLSIATEPKI